MKVLHAIYKQIWKIQQWPKDCFHSKDNFHSNPKERQSPKCSNYRTIALISHTGKVMLKILQAKLQQSMNRELPDIQTGFRKGRGTRDQIANIHWIIKIEREFQENFYFCLIDYARDFDCVDHNKLRKILKEMGIPEHLTCLLRNLNAGQEATVRTGHGTTDWYQIGKGVHQTYYHPAYLTYMQSTLWEIDGETVETVSDYILGGSKITANGDGSHEIKRCLLLGRKVMTNLDSILKSRDITLPIKVCLVNAMVFPVVMYGCES